jgi:hypothetical protein
MLCRLSLAGGHKYILITAAKEGLKEQVLIGPTTKLPLPPSAGEDAWQVELKASAPAQNCNLRNKPQGLATITKLLFCQPSLSTTHCLRTTCRFHALKLMVN